MSHCLSCFNSQRFFLIFLADYACSWGIKDKQCLKSHYFFSHLFVDNRIRDNSIEIYDLFTNKVRSLLFFFIIINYIFAVKLEILT